MKRYSEPSMTDYAVIQENFSHRNLRPLEKLVFDGGTGEEGRRREEKRVE